MRRLRSSLVFGILLSIVACQPGSDESAGSLIAADELSRRIEAVGPPLVLDVRTRDEFTRGHIPGAMNIPHGELPARLAEIPVAKSDEIVVHCQSGRRAELASATLREHGYSNVRALEGHWAGWRARGLPIESLVPNPP